MDYTAIATRVNNGEVLVYGSPEYRYYWGQISKVEFNKEMA